jgi:hypothetical protein
MMSALKRLRNFLRLAPMALLLLITMSNPILAGVGELHDAISSAVAIHHGDTTASAGAQTAGAQDHDAGSKDLFHALIHGAHCCGHLTAILQISVQVTVRKFSVTAPHSQAEAKPADRPFELNRPPITA